MTHDNPRYPYQHISRRSVLKALAASTMSGSLWASRSAAAAPAETWQQTLVGYLESLARPDGGYGWHDQPDSHLTPAFAVTGCYHFLGRRPPRPEQLAEFLRGHHPITGQGAETSKHAADLRSFVYQQIQGLLWLGQAVDEFAEQARGWTKLSRYPEYYERHGFPILQQEAMGVVCRQRLGLSAEAISPEWIAYFESRRRRNGSFNNTPAEDGSDGHVLNTWWGLMALGGLGRGRQLAKETVGWLEACQLPCGGFSYQPAPKIAGIDDVMYTWAAVLALQHFGAAPARRDECVAYLLSLRNADGGCGDRPGLPSQAVPTYYALEALAALGALQAAMQQVEGVPRAAHPPVLALAGQQPVAPAPTLPHAAAKPLPSGLRPWSIQIQAHGTGSPIEAVELARSLRIDLWGAKNSKPQWIAKAQAIAQKRKVPVTFFVANEEYGTYMSLPGLGSYSHLSDPMWPAGADAGPSLAGQHDNPWSDFRRQRLAPLERAGGRMVWQINDNEEYSRILFDDSVERGGYAAISTFHHPQNFAYMLPFLFRYRDLIPMVALQDAHGPEAWWWADELTGYRTVFLATEPTWDAWLAALKQNWVVAIRHDDRTGYRTRMLGGAPGVQALVRKHEDAWKWWGAQPEDLKRPLVSIVAVRPEDEFEVARPTSGVTLRVRCWWRGRMRREEPVVELVSLKLDGRLLKPALVEKKEKKNLIDHYHQCPLPDPGPGRHTVAATVRILGSKAEVTETSAFDGG